MKEQTIVVQLASDESVSTCSVAVFSKLRKMCISNSDIVHQFIIVWVNFGIQLFGSVKINVKLLIANKLLT